MFRLRRSQSQRVTFVMIDVAGTEVSGIADLAVAVSKNGAAFVAGAGAAAEIGSGWYSYTLTAGETDTTGPLSIQVTGSGALAQNLAYEVESLVVGGIEFTYTLTDDITALPVEGAAVWFTTDTDGENVVWYGETDAFGVARDVHGQLPFLAAGTYSVWRSKPGYSFDDPDSEEVS